MSHSTSEVVQSICTGRMTLEAIYSSMYLCSKRHHTLGWPSTECMTSSVFLCFILISRGFMYLPLNLGNLFRSHVPASWLRESLSAFIRPSLAAPFCLNQIVSLPVQPSLLLFLCPCVFLPCLTSLQPLRLWRHVRCNLHPQCCAVLSPPGLPITLCAPLVLLGASV